MFGQRGAKKEVLFKKFFKKFIGVAKKSQLTFITKEADSFVNASKQAFTTKPLGTISSVAKCFFRKTCCKSVAKTDFQKCPKPQTVDFTGFFGTSQPRGFIPTPRLPEACL